MSAVDVILRRSFGKRYYVDDESNCACMAYMYSNFGDVSVAEKIKKAEAKFPLLPTRSIARITVEAEKLRRELNALPKVMVLAPSGTWYEMPRTQIPTLRARGYRIINSEDCKVISEGNDNIYIAYSN